MNFEYEKKLRRQQLLFFLTAIFYVAVVMVGLHGMKTLQETGEHWRQEAHSVTAKYSDLKAEFETLQDNMKETAYQYEQKIKNLNADKDDLKADKEKLEEQNNTKDKEIESLKKTLRTLN